jgi:outer membrane protein TolC
MTVRTRRLWALVALLALTAAGVPFTQASAQIVPVNPVTETLPTHAPMPTAVPSPVLPNAPEIAPGYIAPDVRQDTANIIGVTQQPFVGISLQDAIGMALSRNPNLAISASNARIAAYQVVEARGAFDVKLIVQPQSNYNVQPPLNIFDAGPGPEGRYINPDYDPTQPISASNPQYIYSRGPGNVITHQTSTTYGVGGLSVNGTQFNAGIDQTRTYNNTLFNQFNPYYLASLNLSVTQPLLRNAGMNAGKRQLQLALINADSNSQSALVNASDTIAQVSSSYWNLVAAWRNVTIQEEALKDAVTQQHSIVRLAKRGATAPIDATEAATQVATFQDDVYSALQTVSELQNQLKALIVTDAGDKIWEANLLPTSQVAQLPQAPTLQTVVQTAVRNRPEIQQSLDRYKQADIDLKFAKNQALPQADAAVTFQSNGFAGLLQPDLPFETSQCNGTLHPGGGIGSFALPNCPTPAPDTQGKMAQAYHNMWSVEFPTFNIGVTISFPFNNEYAKGLKGTAIEEQRQAAVYAAGVSARIGFDARNALQTFQSAVSRLHTARIAREASELVYASEQRKYKNGASTTFLVLQRQVELLQNRGRELQAQTDLNRAVVEIQRVEGTILTDNGVKVQRLGQDALPGNPAPLPPTVPGLASPKP